MSANKRPDVRVLRSSLNIKAGPAFLMTAALLIWSTVAWSGDLGGWITLNYLMQEENGETFFSTEQRIRLNWATALSNTDLLNFYGQFSQRRRNNPDTEEFRPLLGFNLSGSKYSWILEYREFEQRNLEEGGFTLTNRTFFSTFDFNPDPFFPDLLVDFTRTEAQDNMEDPETDFVQTDWGLRTSYEKGSLTLRYSHRESEFDNNITTLTTAILQGVTGVAVDGAGIIYITDTVANRVLRFSSSGEFLGEFGSTGSGEGQFLNPSGIEVTRESIYVVDTGNNRVQQFDVTGRFISEWGIFGTQEGRFDHPYGITVDGTGIYVTDQGNDRVQKFTIDGRFILTFGVSGSGPGNFSSPSGIASGGNRVFVADTQNHRLQVFTTGGEFVEERGFFGSGPGQFQFPTDVGLDSTDRIYVTDSGNNRIQVFTKTGIYLDEFGSFGPEAGQFDAPTGLAMTPADNIVVADYNNDRFQVFTNNGVFLFEVGSVSGEERSQSTRRSSDLFSLFFGREMFKGFYASVDYDVFRSNEEDKDSGRELVSTVNHDLNGQVRLEPFRWIALNSSYNLKFFNTDAGDLSANRNEFIQTHVLSLQPVQRVNISASHTRSSRDNTIGFNEDSNTTLLSLHLLPTNRLNLNFSSSKQEDRQEGGKLLKSDVLSSSADMKIFQGIDLIVNYSLSHVKETGSESGTDSQRIRSRLRLNPRHNLTLFTTFEYNTSDSKIDKSANVSSRTLLGSLDLSWAISRRLDLFFNIDYRNNESDSESRDNLGYLANLIWRMNDKLTFFLGYRGGSEEEDISNFRSQAKFPFFWHTRMSINYEIEKGTEETDRNYVFIELTKIF